MGAEQSSAVKVITTATPPPPRTIWWCSSESPCEPLGCEELRREPTAVDVIPVPPSKVGRSADGSDSGHSAGQHAGGREIDGSPQAVASATDGSAGPSDLQSDAVDRISSKTPKQDPMLSSRDGDSGPRTIGRPSFATEELNQLFGADGMSNRISTKTTRIASKERGGSKERKGSKERQMSKDKSLATRWPSHRSDPAKGGSLASFHSDNDVLVSVPSILEGASDPQLSVSDGSARMTFKSSLAGSIDNRIHLSNTGSDMIRAMHTARMKRQSQFSFGSEDSCKESLSGSNMSEDSEEESDFVAPEFLVDLANESGSLGIRVLCVWGEYLLITEISPHGAIGRWNEAHPNERVELGDMVMEVDGTGRGHARQMERLLVQGGRVEGNSTGSIQIIALRHEAFEISLTGPIGGPPGQQQPGCLGLVYDPVDNGRLLRVTGVREGVVAKWNMEAEAHNLSVKDGDLILEANGVSGDAKAMEAALEKGSHWQMRAIHLMKPLVLRPSTSTYFSSTHGVRISARSLPEGES